MFSGACSAPFTPGYGHQVALRFVECAFGFRDPLHRVPLGGCCLAYGHRSDCDQVQALEARESSGRPYEPPSADEDALALKAGDRTVDLALVDMAQRVIDTLALTSVRVTE